MSALEEQIEAPIPFEGLDPGVISNIAVQEAKLPFDGGPAPTGRANEVALVRINAGCIWPPDRHVVGHQDVIDAEMEARIADQAEIEAKYTPGITQSAFKLIQFEAMKAYARFRETHERALQDAQAVGYQLGLQRPAATGVATGSST